jgi:hypothetical protein
VTATTRHSTREPPKKRSRVIRAATGESDGRRQAMPAMTRLRRAVPAQSQAHPCRYTHRPTAGAIAVASMVDMPQ